MNELSMPSDFPSELHASIHQRVTSAFQGEKIARSEFLGGWSAVRYRFMTCAESDEAFRRSLAEHGDTPPMVQRYEQERELFAFFVAGLSALESLCYAVFAIGSLLDPAAFRMENPEDRRRVSVKSTVQRILETYPTDALSTGLSEVAKSGELRDWADRRNTLAHRLSPPRRASIFVGSIRGRGPTVWGEELVLDANTTKSRREWLSKTLRDILTNVELFTQSHCH